MWLRKAHYNVMCRVLKPFEANILAGRAKTVDARHYAMRCMNWIPCQRAMRKDGRNLD